jgi:hypothetical protein
VYRPLVVVAISVDKKQSKHHPTNMRVVADATRSLDLLRVVVHDRES